MVVSRCLSSANPGRKSTCSRFQQAWSAWCSSRSAGSTLLAPSAIHVSTTVTHWSSQTVEQHPRQGNNRRCRRFILLRRPVTSLLFGGRPTTKVFRRPWHDSEFMQGSSPEALEEWLLSLMQSTRRNADKKGIFTTTNDDHSRNTIVYFDECFEIDSFAYLRVLEGYARSAGPGSSQKCEYWIGVLERHYAAATELFYGTYGTRLLDSAHRSPSPQSISCLDYPIEHSFEALAKRNQTKSENEKLGTPVNDQRENAVAIVQSLQPTVECYNAVIEVWANDKDPISVVRSRRWLSKLEDEAKNADNRSIIRSPLLPNARSYDLYLRSCSRGIGKQHKLHKERAEEAEEILHHRLSPHASLDIRPSAESFNYVLRAWTRCRNEISVAAKVMNLVLTMERIQKEFILADEKGVDVDGEDFSWKRDISPDTKSYTMVLDGWVINAGIKAEKWRSARVRALNSTKNANMQRGREKSGGSSEQSIHVSNVAQDDDGSNEMEKAETILTYIDDLDRIGHSDVRATVIGYNTLLSGWARLANEFRPSIPLKSEKILHDMMALAEQGNANAAPDVTSFNAVIKAWGRTKQANSALRCEFWLRKMIREGGSNFMAKPDVATYNLCMDAHLNVGDAPRVEDLLIEMDATNDVSPNSESYSKVIRAWLDDEMNGPHYGLPGSSCVHASNWLNKLLDKEKSCEASMVGPAPELFSAILKTAARTSARGEILLTIGMSTFGAYKRSRFAVDHLAYIWLLEIALKVLSSPNNDKRREEVVTELFKQCCKDGFLSSQFLSKLTEGPFHDEGWTREESERLCRELLGDPPYATAWSRNLKDQSHHPRANDYGN